MVSAYLMAFELKKAECQSSWRNFKEIIFFLLKEVMPVKYKLFLLRNIHFNIVVFWSSTERHIHHITAWSTWILNMWCLVSNLTLKDNGKILNFFFHFALKWFNPTVAILRFWNFFCLSDFFHCRRCNQYAYFSSKCIHKGIVAILRLQQYLYIYGKVDKNATSLGKKMVTI